MVNDEILPPNAPKHLRRNADAIFGKIVTETRKMLEKTTLESLGSSSRKKR